VPGVGWSGAVETAHKDRYKGAVRIADSRGLLLPAAELFIRGRGGLGRLGALGDQLDGQTPSHRFMKVSSPGAAARGAPRASALPRDERSR
jgi:hypothetical protein